MNSILEEIRFCFEEIEFYQSLFIEEMLNKPSCLTEKIQQQHNASHLLDNIVELANQIPILNNPEQMAKEQSRILVGSNLSLFYEDLSKISNHHRSNSRSIDELELRRRMYLNFKEISAIENLFTGEEVFGKFLDLNNFLIKYNSLKGIEKPLDLVSYLATVDDFIKMKKDYKIKSEYKAYLGELKLYLEQFICKSMPLFNFNGLVKDLESDFVQLWLDDKIEHWKPDLPSIKSDAIWCGKCAKYFSKKSVFDAHLSVKKHTKSLANTPQPGSFDSTEKNREEFEKIAFDEFLIENYFQILDSKRNDTISNVERKKVQTLREREESEEEDVIGNAENEEEVAETKIYNPLKIPLDWDGKPIPYWLWKLHGLGTEYPCEICGGFVYMGRKAFDRHFQEWRHAYGMKCLGLMNSKHFYGITTIK